MQIWIQNAKITLWKNFGQFFRFHQFWSSGPCMRKKGQFSISGNFFRFEFRTQKLPYDFILVIRSYERISAIFLVIRYAKKDHISILAVIQKIWDLHKFGLQIWIQNAKITLWKNFGQFFRFHRFWSSGPGMQKKITSQY